MSKTKKFTLWGLVFVALVVAFYIGTGYQENKMNVAAEAKTL